MGHIRPGVSAGLKTRGERDMAGTIDPNDAMVVEFSKLGTTGVSDAMDRLGLGGQVLGVKPVGRDFTLCGRAFTVRNEPMTAGHKGESVGDYIDDVPVGGVVVIDNGGTLTIATIQALAAIRKPRW